MSVRNTFRRFLGHFPLTYGNVWDFVALSDEEARRYIVGKPLTKQEFECTGLEVADLSTFEDNIYVVARK